MTVYTSGTQLEVWDDCIRKWFFKWVMKLAEVIGPARPLGTVFHSVAQRYLDGDDAGRDKKGNPVDLTPKGWLTTDDGVVPDADGAMILLLVQKGIEEGILEKLPGRLTEERFERQVIPGVNLVGYMDVYYPNEDRVDDHKTCSDWKWALSPEKIEKDPKMLCYAVEAFMRKFEAGEDLPEHVLLRHNQFLKGDARHINKKSVRYRQGAVTQEEVEVFWNKLQGIAESMLEAHQHFKKGDLDWNEVPCCRDDENYEPCNKYGGCPFLRICTEQETAEGYRKRLDRILSKTASENAEDANLVTKEKKSMGIFEKIKKDAAAKKGATESQTEESQVEETAEEEVTEAPPPWAQENCTACEGGGFKSSGPPCKICDDVNRALGQPLSGDYEKTDDGWVLRSELEEEEAPQQEEKPKPKGKGLPGAKKGAAKAKASEKDEEPTKAAAASTAKATASKGSRGRPPAGFTLCIQCAPTKIGSRDTVSADFLFLAAQERVLELAKAEEKFEDAASFYELPPFPRRDQLAVVAEQLVGDLGPVHVIASSGSSGPDFKALLEVLKAHAQTVYEGTSS